MAKAAGIYSRDKNRKPALVVLVIEIGETYSGYAFSFSPDYQNDPMRIAVKDFGGFNGEVTSKAPMVLLLKPDRTFHSFGYEAQRMYDELKCDDEHHNYHFFRHFPSIFGSSKGLSPERMTIEDETKQPMSALTVYSMSIKFFKDHALREFSNSLLACLPDDDIFWVLTGPAICQDESKQFMTKAATMAGIKCENLAIVREDEALSRYYMHIPMMKGKSHKYEQMFESLTSTSFDKGTRFMLINAGDTMVQVSIYEVVDADKLLRLGNWNHHDCGEKNVDAAFEQMLKDIFGPDTFDQFKRDYSEDYKDLCRTFKVFKCNWSPRCKQRLNMPILKHLYEIRRGEKGQKTSINDRIKEMKEFEGKVQWRYNGMKIDEVIVQSWYDKPCTSIAQHVKKCFKYIRCKGINDILLVGGFAMSTVLQTVLKSTFADKSIIIPEAPDRIVLIGAMMYGRNPLTTEDSVALASEISLEWKRGKEIGKGSFGTVRQGLTNQGQLIAVKQIELDKNDMSKTKKEYEKTVEEEVELLKSLKHTNIVGYLGTSLEDSVFNIFMELVPGGSIAKLLKEFGALDESVFQNYTRQILEGVKYLHENGVIHRDIKGGNVMLMPSGVIKLIDFGLAKRFCMTKSMDQSEIHTALMGSPYWMAPEVVEETGYGRKADIWSVGCTVFEMATKNPPWTDKQTLSAVFIAISTKPAPRLPVNFSADARSFVLVCLTKDKNYRPTASELLESPFMRRV